MTDELKQWEYDRGYAQGKADVLEKIRAEIEKKSEITFSKSRWGESAGLNTALEIIDKHLSEVSE